MRKSLRELLETIILTLLVFLTLQFSIQNYVVDGPSMKPTLEDGEYVIVNKLSYLHFEPRNIDKFIPFYTTKNDSIIFPFDPPKRGEILVFYYPRDVSRKFVKRIIGIPGETVEIKHGEVFINGKVIEEPYVSNQSSSNLAPTTIPNDKYFVLGDNRKISNDSRSFGLVPTENVVGKTWFRFWPINKWEFLNISI